jgi:hypothetical protein
MAFSPGSKHLVSLSKGIDSELVDLGVVSGAEWREVLFSIRPPGASGHDMMSVDGSFEANQAWPLSDLGEELSISLPNLLWECCAVIVHYRISLMKSSAPIAT